MLLRSGVQDDFRLGGIHFCYIPPSGSARQSVLDRAERIELAELIVPQRMTALSSALEMSTKRQDKCAYHDSRHDVQANFLCGMKINTASFIHVGDTDMVCRYNFTIRKIESVMLLHLGILPFFGSDVMSVRDAYSGWLQVSV